MKTNEISSEPFDVVRWSLSDEILDVLFNGPISIDEAVITSVS